MSIESDQVELAPCPEIVRAHRYHRRLIGRLGRVPVALAYHEAQQIHLEWVSQGRFQDIRFSRFRRLLGADWRVNRESAVLHAAIHPEVVALAGLLGSVYWRGLAASSRQGDVMRFYGEVGSRVHAGYQRPADYFDPLGQWAEEQVSAHRLGRTPPSPSDVFAMSNYGYTDTH
ncbi:hypothetical protein ACQEVF_47870 [Nonomuraea polychroma]|uniref:hypothetical protein n=1 Tax=Nonomuraea polychroma TaxID=46176 RepID=UPI003D8CBA1A